MYIWQEKEWPHFGWDTTQVAVRLEKIKLRQQYLYGVADTVGLDVRNSTVLTAVTENIVASSEIEGIELNSTDVRSSIAWQLGIENAALPSENRYIEGTVEVMLDAIHNCNTPLSEERLFYWHTLLFPHQSKLRPITIGNWRQSTLPMQVVSGRYGKETVHYEAPPSGDVPALMADFIRWINHDDDTDMILKAAIAHLWFVSIHPFSDGNGRLARTITDMLLAKNDNNTCRLYSISAQMSRERKNYYSLLEQTQKGNMDITAWLMWFLDCLEHAIEEAKGILEKSSSGGRSTSYTLSLEK